MKQGLNPIKKDRRDYDFHKTFGSTTFNTGTLPTTYLADAGLTMFDQNREGFPEGCTGYAQTDLCTDEDRMIYDAGEFYLATPPGGAGAGRDIRDSLKLLISRGPHFKDGSLGTKRTGYFNVNASSPLDWFDAIRVALWITQDEHRAISVGIPWFIDFETNVQNGLLPIPVNFSWSQASGHNAVIAGWTPRDSTGNWIRNGEVFLMVKSWQGPNYGDKGWAYLSRPLANAIFAMPYTGAYTVSKIIPGTVQTINWSIIDTLIAFIRSLINQ